MAGRKRTRRRGKGEGTVSQRKDGAWEGKISLGYDGDGKRRRKTVYGKTQAEVLEKVRRLKEQHALGMSLDVELTVAGYLQSWLKEVSRRVKPRTAYDYRYDCEHYLIPRIGRLKLSKLTPVRLQAALGDIADSVSADRANKCRRTLYGALKQALRLQLIVLNPGEAIAPFKQAKPTMDIWEPEEAARFLAVARAHRLYAAFYLDMSTGLCRGELLGLRWQDVEGNTLHIRQTVTDVGGKIAISTPKTEKGNRRVTLSPDVLAVLEQHRLRQDAERLRLGDLWSGTDLVFTNEVGTFIHPRNFTRTQAALQRKAGVTHTTTHKLRHFNVSMRRSQGQDAKVIANQVGHTDPAFTMRLYAHLFDDDLQGAAVSLSDFLPPREGQAN